MQQQIKKIVLDYNDLMNDEYRCEKDIEIAFGGKGLGVLFVKNIPKYQEIRKKLLVQLNYFVKLPENQIKKYTRPQIFHSLGWSTGVQYFQGQPDFCKGSYYSNAVIDYPDVLTSEEKAKYSQGQLKFRQPNVWVDQIPQIELHTKQMNQLMIHVGCLVARQVDYYCSSIYPSYNQNLLLNTIRKGRSHFARLLHYFPYESIENRELCGWHNDHGALTALTSSIYYDENGQEYQVDPTSTGGLYAKNRFSQQAKIKIPHNMLAFQIGQSAQILSGGVLEATPHCVYKNPQLAGKKISRNTFALFMQPNFLQVLSVPKNVPQENVYNKKGHNVASLQQRWKNGDLFKDFHGKTLQTYSVQNSPNMM